MIDTSKNTITICSNKEVLNKKCRFAKTTRESFVTSKLVGDLDYVIQPLNEFEYSFKKNPETGERLKVLIKSGTIISIKLNKYLLPHYFFIVEILPQNADMILGTGFMETYGGYFDNEKLILDTNKCNNFYCN